MRSVTYQLDASAYHRQSVAHVVELFLSQHCPGCPETRETVRELVRRRRDLTVVERDVDEAEGRDLARVRHLIATPAIVIDGERVLYGMPTAAALEHHLDRSRLLSPGRLAVLTVDPYTPAMAAHGKLWYLQHFRMLDALSDAQKHNVDQMTRMLEVRRGERIYITGDPSDQIFLLKAGAVKISSSGPDGQETILAFLHPGDLFGELAIVDDTPRDHVATAHDDTVLCAINRDMVLKLAQQSPALGYHITKLMGLRLRRFRMRLEELLCRNAPARVAHALVDLAAECGVRDSAGTLIRLRLNQGDLGNLVGLARETVNIILQDFRQRGLIVLEGKKIRITNEVGLREVGG